MLITLALAPRDLSESAPVCPMSQSLTGCGAKDGRKWAGSISAQLSLRLQVHFLVTFTIRFRGPSLAMCCGYIMTETTELKQNIPSLNWNWFSHFPSIPGPESYIYRTRHILLNHLSKIKSKNLYFLTNFHIHLPTLVIKYHIKFFTDLVLI